MKSANYIQKAAGCPQHSHAWSMVSCCTSWKSSSRVVASICWKRATSPSSAPTNLDSHHWNKLLWNCSENNNHWALDFKQKLRWHSQMRVSTLDLIWNLTNTMSGPVQKLPPTFPWTARTAQRTFPNPARATHPRAVPKPEIGWSPIAFWSIATFWANPPMYHYNTMPWSMLIAAKLLEAALPCSPEVSGFRSPNCFSPRHSCRQPTSNPELMHPNKLNLSMFPVGVCILCILPTKIYFWSIPIPR